MKNKCLERKERQLGMSWGRARHMLHQDIMFEFVVSKRNCYHCGLPMTRDNFSIEHKSPWLDSEDPKGKFFEIDNIDFSHLNCNVAKRRNSRSSAHGSIGMYRHHRCRCALCKHAWNAYKRGIDSPEKRRARYLRPLDGRKVGVLRRPEPVDEASAS